MFVVTHLTGLRMVAFLALFRTLAAQTHGTPFDLPSEFINPLIGNTGIVPHLLGGTLPSIAPPFGSCRWVTQNQLNVQSISILDIAQAGNFRHGFIGTRQPAIWMGESAWAGVVPGSGKRIRTEWDDRKMQVVNGTEVFGVGLYSVELALPNGDGEKVKVEIAATSRVGHFRFTFTDTTNPYILVPITRQSAVFHHPDIFDTSYFPTGTVNITQNGGVFEICGSNSEQQDLILAPTSIAENAKNFKGFSCARFDADISPSSFGISSGTSISEHATSGLGTELGAFVRFSPSTPTDSTVVTLRIGTSLISTDQARWNIDHEVPDANNIDDTRTSTEALWAEKVGRFEIETDDVDSKTVFLTGVVRALQFPYEVHDTAPENPEVTRYYSAYDNAIHVGESYNGYSIWDTYRAAWATELLFAPERIPGLVRSMLNDFREGGWLPMWKNIVETNIMISTHADSLLAEMIRKGFISAFSKDELRTLWEAVWKDASVPPVKDTTTIYDDRQEGVDFEARAGLTTYMDPSKGWVAVDVHSESASRTLDYAYDDHLLSILASFLPANITAHPTIPNVTEFLDKRARTNPWTLWNANASSESGQTQGYIQAKFLNGSTDPDVRAGFTEGTREVYSITQGLVWGDMINELAERRGGVQKLKESLDEFFDNGEVQFTNEPSHHTPYLYPLVSPEFASSSQKRIRELAIANYNNTPRGMSGNEDCGQTSSWYIFSAMGLYPVDPASGEYVLGSPFFSKMSVHIPRSIAHSTLRPPQGSLDSSDPFNTYNTTTDSFVLTVVAEGAEKKWYAKDVKVNGVSRKDSWKITHEEILWGGLIEFDMTEQPE